MIENNFRNAQYSKEINEFGHLNRKNVFIAPYLLMIVVRFDIDKIEERKFKHGWKRKPLEALWNTGHYFVSSSESEK